MEATRDLGPLLKSGELAYVCDKATLEEIKVALEVVRDQRLTKLSYTTRVTPAIVEEDVDSLDKARRAGGRALFSSYVLERTCKDIGEAVKKSIEDLNLEGMPVGRWLKSLNLGLSKTLRKLSLRHCRVGNDGCKTLRLSGVATTLIEIDLACCAIEDCGAKEIAAILAAQSFRRVIDPKFEGLQKVILNFNPIGDAGCEQLVNVLLNDYWVKSVEMRSCKITTPGDALRLAIVNKVIEVFDLRENLLQIRDTADEIQRILSNRHPPEMSVFKWAKVSQND